MLSLAKKKHIFLTALDFPPGTEREAYLAEACQGDPALRESVNSLLAADDEGPCILDRGLPLIEEIRPHLDQAADGKVAGVEEPRPVERDHVGELIGHYRLLEKIGEGGFGLVFVAQQDHPVRRRVAVKLLKPGMYSRGVLARFEAERQALAIMDHPNIARVFDAGTIPTGEPYFAMELVRGVPITVFCEEHKLGVRERLELFIDVCHAVQHAHQKGVIHRDLKPSNIMVTLHDTRAVVKVIDFGVAKAIGEPLTEKAIYTRFMDLIGTPMYMSPEQAEMNSLDVDTRSDVFSLGMVLFEVLTGSTPYDKQRLNTVAFDEMRRIIREEALPAPSRHLTTLGSQQSTVAARRRLTPDQLTSALRGDLDWIVGKAADKDRVRRYDSAAALARDVRRHLDNEPVEARPPSAWYRFAKLARRNRVAFTAAAFVLAAMILGTGVSLWQAARAAAERDEKERAREDAVRARRETEEFYARLKEVHNLLAEGRAHGDVGLWRAAATAYNLATQIQPNDYVVWQERGAFHVRLGLWNEAASDYTKALQLNAPVTGPEWWAAPQLLRLTGDESGSRDLSRRMWNELPNGADDLLFWAVRSCVFAPESPIEIEQVSAEIERLYRSARQRVPQLSKSFSGIQAGIPLERHPEAVWRLMFGLARYRQGRFAEAIDELLASQSGTWVGRPSTHPALAMAYFRTGQEEKARSELAMADRVMDEWTVALLEGDLGTSPTTWFDYLEFLLLHREATSLLTHSPPKSDPRWERPQKRAREAIQ